MNRGESTEKSGQIDPKTWENSSKSQNPFKFLSVFFANRTNQAYKYVNLWRTTQGVWSGKHRGTQGNSAACKLWFEGISPRDMMLQWDLMWYHGDLVGGWALPLWKMMEWKSDGMIIPFPIWWEKSHVPNHQPGIYIYIPTNTMFGCEKWRDSKNGKWHTHVAASAWYFSQPAFPKSLVFLKLGTLGETVPGLVTASSLWWLRTVGNLGGHPSQVRLCLKIGRPSNPMFSNMYEFLRTTHPTDYSLVETLKHINWDHHSKVRSWPVLDTQLVVS